ncbi:ubiquitin-specific protease [Rhizoctonia solani AG-1 IA]|uniref:ubiquitinyl hydrolase 1 n=1 Tax=Thanatephorus cucumeris (strain AG1-IA) TaxID=983506 RepID=L8WEI5_THACA|nr:ubiquitin-specific protease [Rhizoctonia solani AG-1 IA]
MKRLQRLSHWQPTWVSARVKSIATDQLHACLAAEKLLQPSTTVSYNRSQHNGIRPTDTVRGSLLLIPSDSKIRISDFIKISDVLAVETQCQPGVWTLEAKSVATLSDPTFNDEIAPDDAPEPEQGGHHPSAMSTLKITLTSTFRGKARPQRYGEGPRVYKICEYRVVYPIVLSLHPNLSSHTFALPLIYDGYPISYFHSIRPHTGNTCFMNSTLQYLTHIPELEEYFLSGLYKQGLNYDNPLDMQGQITNVFGALIHHLYPSPNSSAEPATKSYRWGNSTNSYAPREFKHTLGKFAPAFSGYQQLESSEGGDQKAVAKETWEGHKKRNDSIIVDLFQGMYKSTLVCSKCSKVSLTLLPRVVCSCIRPDNDSCMSRLKVLVAFLVQISIAFDPFMYLTLPLPVTKTWRHIIHWVPWDTRKRTLAVEIEVPKDSSYGYLKKLFAKWFGVEAENVSTPGLFPARAAFLFCLNLCRGYLFPVANSLPALEAALSHLAFQAPL